LTMAHPQTLTDTTLCGRYALNEGADDDADSTAHH
jgi:hypothetical protein